MINVEILAGGEPTVSKSINFLMLRIEQKENDIMTYEGYMTSRRTLEKGSI